MRIKRIPAVFRLEVYMMTLNENKIIRYYLGIWDDFSDVSVKDWACRVFRYEISESEAQDILDMLRWIGCCGIINKTFAVKFIVNFGKTVKIALK